MCGVFVLCANMWYVHEHYVFVCVQVLHMRCTLCLYARICGGVQVCMHICVSAHMPACAECQGSLTRPAGIIGSIGLS